MDFKRQRDDRAPPRLARDTALVVILHGVMLCQALLVQPLIR